MKILMTAILVLLVLLALTSGTSKIMLLEQEVQFFGAAGFSNSALQIFGATQLAVGLLMVFSRYRIAAAVVLALTLIASTILILMDGKTAFGLVSIIPILLVAVLIRDGRAKLEGTT